MSLTLLNVGTVPDDGTGDTARNGGLKIIAAMALLNIMVSPFDTYMYPTGDATGAGDLAQTASAATLLASSSRTVTNISAFCATGKITLAPGTFYFTQPNINLLPATSLKMTGFEMHGSGRGVTAIAYNPATSGPMLVNTHWLNVRMSNMTVVCNDANSDFLWSQEQATNTNVQDYKFRDMDFQGNWNYLNRVTGGNNNSEWSFEGCSINGPIDSWIYVPPAVTATIAGGTTITCINDASQIQLGDTGYFDTAVAPIAAGPGNQYYVVSVTGTTFQVATTPGGSPINFTATGTPKFSTGNDQFLNFWFSKCKFDTHAGLGRWINMSFGGSIKIRDCDVSGRNPSAPAYIFNLLGSQHAGGVMNFEVDGLRIEHAGNNCRTIQCEWASGSVSWKNLDESSQAGQRPITNEYALYTFTNSRGPLIKYESSQLMGVHRYSNNTSNSFYQNEVKYEQCTLLDNPTADDFIQMTNLGNSGGYPVIEFEQCRNTLISNVAGYREVVDCSLNYQLGAGRVIKKRMVNFISTNSDWPSTAAGSFDIMLPRKARYQGAWFTKDPGSGNGGAFEYSLRTTEASPTLLCGGPATVMAGTNAGTAVAQTFLSTNQGFIMDTDAKRRLRLIDSSGTRSGIFTRVQLWVEYVG